MEMKRNKKFITEELLQVQPAVIHVHTGRSRPDAALQGQLQRRRSSSSRAGLATMDGAPATGGQIESSRPAWGFRTPALEENGASSARDQGFCLRFVGSEREDVGVNEAEKKKTN